MPIVSSVLDRVTSAGSDVADRFLRPSGRDGQRFYLDVLDELRADPTYALETIALRSVEVHGAAAKAWLQETSHLSYSQEQLAKIAIKRTTNLARLEGATLGFGGFLTVAPDVAAIVYLLTREVVFVAAAYGYDPTHRDRAAELLVVTQVYGSIEEAKAGLERRGERIAVRLAKNQVRNSMKGSGKRQRTIGERMIRYAGKRAAKRFGGRMVPGIGAVLGAIDNGAAARETGERAIEFYRPHGTASRGRLHRNPPAG